MKWVALLAVLGLLPVLVGWLRTNRRYLPRVMMVFGALPFFTSTWHLLVAPISWAYWPGFVKGAEVTLIDALAIALIVSTPRKFRRVHLRWPLIAYTALVLLSLLQNDVPISTFFYVWQLARMVLVLSAVAMTCRDPKAVRGLILGLILGICFQAVMSLKAHAQGAIQAAGTLGHQNLLGMLTHFVIFPSLAMLLATRKSRWLWLGPIGGLVAVVLTASRATIAFSAAGVVLTLLLSMLRQPSGRKTTVALAGVLSLVVAAPVAYATLGARFSKSTDTGDYDERAAFERAAKAILHDHPLGVGGNHYVIVANTQGYSDRAGVAAVFGSRSAHVHNAYLLSAAETGYAGLVAFVLMLVWPVIVALRCAWRYRRDPRGDVLLGLAVALVMVSLHSFYEWIFVLYVTQYMYAIAVGLIAGIAAEMGYWAPRRKRAAAAPDRDPGAESLAETIPNVA
ncbi:O-antigen ligase [Sphingomonas sp. BK580]|uniref:O-antigen ligase family protein n=1 Tax=Sphingomonas sp. BK580 TaxID=2586972 RepID=UPI001618F0E6|nr:O-antigen ligase family protein [Sphingomonas sp. BK580]MBB3694681.1 O-antigen ligase [Sphingomonas sp. BK580]